MTYNAREYARFRNWVFFLSLVAWIVILLKPGHSSCCVSRRSFESLLALTSEIRLSRDWGLMLIAMMAPTLVPVLYHIRISSFVRRRARSIALFALGYGAVWIAAGSIMVPIELGAAWRAPGSYVPAATIAVVALAWQGSPFKQRCLNRTHSHRPIAAFGIAADWDLFRMGLEHSRWCTGSCWAAMLFPMLLPDGHFTAMVAVGILMFCERLDPPKTPAWRWRGFGTALRYLRLRVCGPRSVPMLFTFGAHA